MALFHDKPTQLAMICGKVVLTGNCTDVIGGTMTAGTFDVDGSGLLTWAPPFISAPIILGTSNSGALTVTSPTVRFTGVGVSTAYLTVGATASEEQTIGIVLMGQAKL